MLLSSSLFRKSSATGSHIRSYRHVEIRLDQPYVVFEGTPLEGAQPVALKGCIYLDQRRSMDIKRIRVKLVGTLELYWEMGWDPGVITRRNDTIYEKEIILLPRGEVGENSSHTIGSGLKEFAFQFDLPPDTHDTVNGLKRDGWRHRIMVNWMIYATIERPFGSIDLPLARKIRIMRIEGPNPDIFDHEQIHQSVWNDKLSYKISVPRVNYVFGTSITAHFELTPLKKGVVIKDVKMELRENTVNTYNDTARNPAGRTHYKDWFTIIKHQTYPVPEISAQRQAPDSTELQDEAYIFDTKMDLPRSFKDCRQMCDTANIKIYHTLRIYVNILNGDQHVSQLKIRAIINLFLSPQLQINEDTLAVKLPTAEVSRQTLNEPVRQEAPPIYNLHHLDQLYDDGSDHGARTAGNTGANTPVFYTQSRRASEEDLRQRVRAAGNSARHLIQGVAAAALPTQDTSNQAASASALRCRLSNLQERAANALPFSSRSRQSGHSPACRDTGGAVTPRTSEVSRPVSDPPSHATSGAPTVTTPATSYYPSLYPSRQASFQDPSPRPSSDHSSYRPGLPSSRNSYVADLPGRTTNLSTIFSSGPNEPAESSSSARNLPYDLHALSKIPSYNTALRTPAPPPATSGPDRPALPSYQTAMSRPSSPPAGTRMAGEGSFPSSGQGQSSSQPATPALRRTGSASSRNSRGSARSNGSDGGADAGRGLRSRLRGIESDDAIDRLQTPPDPGDERRGVSSVDDDLYG